MSNRGQSFADWRAIIWAGAAVLSGCALLVVMDAPAGMPLMNAAAFLIGLTLLGAAHASSRLGAGERHLDWVLLGLALLLPLTALAGPAMDGVSRWLVVAGITVQPGLIVTPLLALAFAARQSLSRLVAIAIASAGLAMQPDPGAAAMLALGLAAPMILRASRSAAAVAASVAAVAALSVSQMRSVTLPAVPFVEHVLADSVAQGPLAMLFVVLTLLFFFLPAQTSGSRQAALGFVGVWAGALAASLLGPYPTPVVGFGGSAVLGYILSVGLLNAVSAKERIPGANAGADNEQDDGVEFRFA